MSNDQYVSVNGAWPETLPALTGEEALAAARKLYRHFVKRSFKGKWKLTSGRRFTYPRGGVFYVNPEGAHFNGWRDLVHSMSHYVHRRTNPGKKPHEWHAWVEREMIRYVIEQGWLTGKLKKAKAEKPKPDMKSERYARVLAAEKRWLTKLKRAQTALKTIKRKRTYYERQLAA